ncbi:MAG: SIMPL domain-containing protein [Flavobacteriales bacterium]|nr:SIMPL domain-containing protein [Flavobacteriales bacterium]MBK7553980.1 SIMPL domain-containing protein [Flavobacteriales bacterium]MBK9194280.1 SIMPL domain-containing protein [Flavobacteriales bacterium]MBP6574381.1 SIMPL domain-containing protein [Flavobacteriales bacterium]
MRLRTIILPTVLASALHAQPQALGNLWYEENSRIFFQQAEQPVKATVQGNMLYLEVNAMMNAKANSYLAIFHITQLGQTAEEADSLMSERVNGLVRRVKKDGVLDSDVFTDMLSFVPVYEYEAIRKLFSKTYQEVPAGFEIQKNIHIRFDDARTLDKLVTAAAKEEIYDLVKVDFFVEQQSACYDTLRMFATRLLQQKLANFEKLGLKVEESHRTAAEKNGAYFPLDRYTTYKAHSQASLNSKRKGQLTNDVRKPTTLFYNKVPYSNFDIVLHAEITEPPVQYTYNLTMVCQLPEAFQKKEKEVKEIIKHIWITDKGDAKTILLP